MKSDNKEERLTVSQLKTPDGPLCFRCRELMIGSLFFCATEKLSFSIGRNLATLQ